MAQVVLELSIEKRQLRQLERIAEMQHTNIVDLVQQGVHAIIAQFQRQEEVLDSFAGIIESVEGDKAYLRLKKKGQEVQEEYSVEFPIDELQKYGLLQVEEGELVDCKVCQSPQGKIGFHIRAVPVIDVPIETRKKWEAALEGLFENVEEADN
ncbi:hypothetical protein H8E77_11145 [bacterium]|nr:hypothetical protein [bacterium]